ncbi:hypothetical protein P3X46_027242 [Hevea brasiliensis]|uniref:PHD-type domain-containing protein n=1 Tax=Hevea brasiliensis TaxID=3981 RepID=A0ABQ9KZ96_HEVBR|nr:uncharacterized protein LOC110646362 [Hevea brasiliensis]XP_057993283.1 uncharacterized protein LOC110646362 [Hevea brasiliensis]KAJ9153845.1 hypothetical protein P3X46_027242 [Hevea brasiliensis]
MDSAGNDESVDGMNPQAECETAAVGEKRPVENGETEELGVRSTKKANCGAGEMQRVAEIVLVLSTMAGMRGGKSPTEAEVNLMAEARAKLVEICQDLAPKDLVARDAIGTVIEDLGLNWKLKDQRLGFRGTRLSIKEKISLSKKKMEESKKFTAPSGTYSSQMSQPNFGAMGDIRGPSNSIRMFSSDKPSNTSIPSGGLPTSATLGHVSAATSTPVANQLLPTEVRASTVSTGLPNSHPGRDSSALAGPRVEKSHFKSEGPNGTSYAPHIQANASANQPLLNATTWSLQSHSMSSAKATPESNVLNHNSAKAEGNTDLGLSRAASQAARDQAFRPFIPQSTAANLPGVHQPVQGVKVVQTSSFFNNHNEIAKIIQKLLQPKLPEHPTWTPPSREYMNKPLTCQMCKVTVNEVETIVLCDACEKGFHLKCLESVNQKGIPRGGEWHCLRCLALSNGKPLPPKYGRVMRSITPPKGPSNPAGAQPSSEKKNGIVDQKFNQEKLMANGSSGLQSSAGSGTVIGNHSEPASDSIAPNAREITGNSFTSRMKNVDQAIRAANLPNNSANSLGVVSDSPSIGLSNEGSIQPAKVSESHIQEEGSVSESKLQPPATLPETISNKFENSKPANSLQDIDRTAPSNTGEVPLKTSQDHSMVEDSESIRGLSDCTPRFDVKQSDQDVTHANPIGSSERNNDSQKHSGMSFDGVHNIEWIGNVLKVSDGKKFYESCLVDGVTYKVQDHALFRSSHEKLIPSKLQAMWEDIKTGSKWVIVNRCYFPGDLPKAVGHPCAPESNEVYESNHQSSVMAGLIQGPCAVLPPTKFQENCERQSQLETEANSGLQPVFICKWFYDEAKGSFQPVFG